MYKIKKLISIALVFVLLMGRFGLVVAYAETTVETTGPAQETQANQEEEVGNTEVQAGEATPTPSPGAELGISNEALVEDDVNSTATTGENEIIEATASATPTPTPTPDQDHEVPPEGGGEEEEEDTAEIETGGAVSVTEVENSVNTTEVNSEVLFQTLNIFVPQDIDLTVSPLTIADEVINNDGNQDEIINVKILDGINYAYVENNIDSMANSGNNSIEGGEDATINTGDAYSAVSLLNKVNATIVDSTVHVVTINIFGEVDGNIILPELGGGEECCAGDLTVSNSAVVKNNVESLANSGQNSIETGGESTDSASIKTGDAKSVVNVNNVVNKTLKDTVFYYLYITVLGTWIGDFLGWDDFGYLEGGDNLTLSSSNLGLGDVCPSCAGDIYLNNHAYVKNNVSSYANTGGNKVKGEDETEINTGSAYSSVSIFNLINTSIIRSFGFFGSVNIFGTLKGNIGGASLFEVEKAKEDPVIESLQGDDQPSPRESGGQLEIYQYNNVNDFVYPGDTVTFFVDIRNPGTGKVYDSVLEIKLIKDGVDKGGVFFELGDINKGEGYRIITGIELSPDAEKGSYLANAKVYGHVGPEDELISVHFDSWLTINGLSPFQASTTAILEEVGAVDQGEVLGAIQAPAGLTKEQKMILFFIVLLSIYIPAKSYQKRRELAAVLNKGGRFIEKKSLALRSFLTSFLA